MSVVRCYLAAFLVVVAGVRYSDGAALSASSTVEVEAGYAVHPVDSGSTEPLNSPYAACAATPTLSLALSPRWTVSASGEVRIAPYFLSGVDWNASAEVRAQYRLGRNALSVGTSAGYFSLPSQFDQDRLAQCTMVRGLVEHTLQSTSTLTTAYQVDGLRDTRDGSWIARHRFKAKVALGVRPTLRPVLKAGLTWRGTTGGDPTHYVEPYTGTDLSWLPTDRDMVTLALYSALRLHPSSASSRGAGHVPPGQDRSTPADTADTWNALGMVSYTRDLTARLNAYAEFEVMNVMQFDRRTTFQSWRLGAGIGWLVEPPQPSERSGRIQ